MATTLVDSNVLLDYLTEDGDWSDWSAAMLVRATDTGTLAINQVIFAEEASLLTLRTVLHLLRRPPAGCEEPVRRHFRRRGRFVLRACEAYLHKGCPVGTLDADACAVTEGSSSQQTCSTGFRLAVARIMPRLVEAFVAIGADGCEQFDAGNGLPPPCTPTSTH